MNNQDESRNVYEEEPLTAEQIENLQAGYAEAIRGELCDAHEMLAEIRA